MAETFERGKQQILFTYLPGKVFDFGQKSIIAKIEKVNGNTLHQLNHTLIVRKVGEHATAWPEQYRPALNDSILADESRFVTIDPTQASSEMYPLVFWCSNSKCKKVFDYTRSNHLPRSKTCPRCSVGKLSQLRFVKVHRCGHIEPLVPWPCQKCHSNEVALDDRGSERLASFRWKCLNCSNVWAIWPGNCTRCSWPSGNTAHQQMAVEVFRSNKTYYVHSATMLNIPESTYNAFFNTPSWYVISTAKYLDIAPARDMRLNDYVKEIGGQLKNNVSDVAFGELLDKLNSGEITVPQYTARISELRSQVNPTTDQLRQTIIQQTGLSDAVLDEAKFDLVDSIVPFEIGKIKDLPTQELEAKTKNLGLARVTLIDDFPIVISSYGFSRVEPKPFGNNQEPLCYLNPFPNDKDQGGRYPIFVDKVQADAIIFQLDPSKIISWLRINGIQVDLHNGVDTHAAELAYFINLFHEVNVYEKIFQDHPIQRLVLGLVHTFSHMAIRQAALLSGLEKTSIAEYIIPKTLTVALYCNHRFGATIGALTALFEQSINEWLDQIELERRCVYDPVCFEKGANCHSCTHLAETSCKLFNQNLSRVYLFGGVDNVLQRDIIGFFDPRIQNSSI